VLKTVDEVVMACGYIEYRVHQNMLNGMWIYFGIYWNIWDICR